MNFFVSTSEINFSRQQQHGSNNEIDNPPLILFFFVFQLIKTLDLINLNNKTNDIKHNLFHHCHNKIIHFKIYKLIYIIYRTTYVSTPEFDVSWQYTLHRPFTPL